MAAPGRGAAADVCTSLALLAAKFEGEGQPLPAIHALYALLQQRTHLLPDQEAVARCTLGRLLLEHTTNLKEARQELMAAQQVATTLVACFCLKCEITSVLARLFRLQAQTNHQVQAYQQGLQLCELGRGSTERPLLLRWAAYFHFQLATAHWEAGEGLARTRGAADQGMSFATQHGMLDMQLVFELLRLQLDLIECEAASAPSGGAPGAPPHAHAPAPRDAPIKQRFASVDALLAALRAQRSASAPASPAGCAPGGSGGGAGPVGLVATHRQPPHGPAPGFLSYAILHSSLLQVLYELGRGRVDKLLAYVEPSAAGGRRQSLVVVQHMRQLLEDCRNKPVGYSWLNLYEAEAAICLCAVMLFMYQGKMRQASEQLELGKAAVQHRLEELGAAGADVCESSLDDLALWSTRVPLVLRLQLLTCEAHLHLSATRLDAARDAVKEVLVQVRRFPHTLASMAGHAHLLAGHYAHALEDVDAAVAHFKAAQQLSTHAPTHLLASALLALTFVCVPGAMEGAQAAVDALGGAYVRLVAAGAAARASGHEPLEAVVGQVATALIVQRMGQHEDANQRLSLVLRVAHKRLMHLALVSLCMCCMVPLQLHMGDKAAANTMVLSSEMMASRNLRTMSQLRVALEAVSKEMGQPERAEEARAAGQQTAAQLAERIRVARTSDAPGHAYILQWGRAPA